MKEDKWFDKKQMFINTELTCPHCGKRVYVMANGEIDLEHRSSITLTCSDLSCGLKFIIKKTDYSYMTGSNKFIGFVNCWRLLK